MEEKETPQQATRHQRRLLWFFLVIIFLCWLSICCVAGEGVLLWHHVYSREPSYLSTSSWQLVPPTATPRLQLTPLATVTPRPRPTSLAESTALPAPHPYPFSSVAAAAPGQETVISLAKAIVPTRDLRSLGWRYHPEWRKQLTNSMTPTPQVYRVGDRAKFWVFDDDKQKHLQITAYLRYVTPHVYFWVEKGIDIKQSDLQQAADTFETKIYPTDHSYFGKEEIPGIDGDVHLFFLISDKLGDNMLGYFSGSDCSPLPVNPYSNEKDMFFLNAQHLSLTSDLFLATAAHEFQHMIQWNQDRNEDTWLNEGFSMLAERLNGFPPSFHIAAFLDKPDTQLTAWSEEDSAPHYGAAELFTTYLYGHLGKSFIKLLAREPKNGMAGINAVLKDIYGQKMKSADLFADWTVANVLNDDNLDGGWYGYHDSQMPTLERSDFEEIDRRPAQRRARVHQYAADYYWVRNFAHLRISFRGEKSVPLGPLGVHSGKYAYWLNAADDSDVSLTRTLDLSTVSKATLRFWSWYDIENKWDFLYVVVSEDGGKTWKMLSNADTIQANPYGNNLGSGLTGLSGRGDHPTWVQERFDLSPWSGKKIQLRFEYVTDDAVVNSGFFVDDVTVPEIGFSDGFESGSNAWQAAGAVRTDLLVPERYAVQVIQNDDLGTKVLPLRLDAEQKGSMTLVANGRGEAIIVVSALAPATREMAPYFLELH